MSPATTVPFWFGVLLIAGIVLHAPLPAAASGKQEETAGTHNYATRVRFVVDESPVG